MQNICYQIQALKKEKDCEGLGCSGNIDILSVCALCFHSDLFSSLWAVNQSKLLCWKSAVLETTWRLIRNSVGKRAGMEKLGNVGNLGNISAGKINKQEELSVEMETCVCVCVRRKGETRFSITASTLQGRRETICLRRRGVTYTVSTHSSPPALSPTSTPSPHSSSFATSHTPSPISQLSFFSPHRSVSATWQQLCQTITHTFIFIPHSPVQEAAITHWPHRFSVCFVALE